MVLLTSGTGLVGAESAAGTNDSGNVNGKRRARATLPHAFPALATEGAIS